jgi:hypothetical protein
MSAANAGFNKLFAMIDAMPNDAQNAAFNFGDDFLQSQKEAHWKRDKNLRDVLIHLYEWHQLLLNWVKSNQNGEPKPFLPEPYNWKTYQQMNVELWQKHQPTPYERSREMLKESHTAVIALIDTFTDKELFSKGSFPWTGGSTLGSYCVSVTSSHYDWAMKKIKQQIKALKGS